MYKSRSTFDHPFWVVESRLILRQIRYIFTTLFRAHLSQTNRDQIGAVNMTPEKREEEEEEVEEEEEEGGGAITDGEGEEGGGRGGGGGGGEGEGMATEAIVLLERAPETTGKVQTADLRRQHLVEVQYYVLHIYTTYCERSELPSLFNGTDFFYIYVYIFQTVRRAVNVRVSVSKYPPGAIFRQN